MFAFNKQDIHANITLIFEEICQNYFYKTAIQTKETSVTYQELNQKTNVIARAIINDNCLKQKPILLIFQQEIELFPSILGVLKTNNIYVVLEPFYPMERQKAIVVDCQPELIVTNSQYLEIANKLSSKSGKIINVDLLEGEFSGDNLNKLIRAKNTAAIIYTSGSTGKPKGIFRSHQSILHRIWLDVQEGFNTVDDRYLSLYSANFAASIADIFSSLLKGSTFYSYNPKQVGLDFILNLIIEEKITILRFPIALFRQFIGSMPDDIKLETVRFIFLSGDKLYKKDVEKIRNIFTENCIIKHQYGASETGAVATFIIDKNTVISSEVVPSGKIVEGKKVIILDKNKQELGINQIGEIAVESDYLASGYWRNPKLTKEKYIRISNHSDKRICLTGDTGKINIDGFLVHSTRKDFMVKVRGYRVEIPEIEAVLYSLDEVKEVVVVLQSLKSGLERLVAYLVPISEVYPKISYLRERLAEKLPDYMIPSCYVILEELPLNDNGKVDRQALPVPPSKRPDLDNPFVAPRYDIEANIAHIWTSVLGIDDIGVEDNFLELGGDSIKAVQIVNQVITTFNIKISMVTLLESGTVAKMADNIIKAQIQLIEGEI